MENASITDVTAEADAQDPYKQSIEFQKGLDKRNTQTAMNVISSMENEIRGLKTDIENQSRAIQTLQSQFALFQQQRAVELAQRFTGGPTT